MELYQLRSFLKIARVQNLTRAATQLHISQSALSSQIKLLEEELELKLFTRSARGMLLTDHGRVMESHVRELIASSDAILQKAKQMAGKITGTFKIGLNTDGHFLQISKLSRELTKKFPEVNFIFVSSQTIRTPDMLRHGHIDLGFHFGEYPGTEFLADPLTEVTIKIAIPEAIHPRTKKTDWKILASLPWIWSVCDCPYYQIIQNEFDKYNLEPNRIIDAMDEDIVKELVLDGQGLAILREDDAYDIMERGNIYVWEKAAFNVPLIISILKNRKEDPTVNAVYGLIQHLWSNER